MYPFAHAGITLGTALLLGNALSRGYSRRSLLHPSAGVGASSSPQPDCAAGCSDNSPAPFGSIARRIDYRLILVGSLLPDIVDKPLTLLLFGQLANAGRLFCHSLLFLVILSLAAVYFYNRRGTTWLLALSFGTFIHLILDWMWLMPWTLLWPIYGWALVKQAPSGFEALAPSQLWSGTFYPLLHSLGSNPAVYIPELVGALILVGFAIMLVLRKRVYPFVKEGTI